MRGSDEFYRVVSLFSNVVCMCNNSNCVRTDLFECEVRVGREMHVGCTVCERRVSKLIKRCPFELL